MVASYIGPVHHSWPPICNVVFLCRAAKMRCLCLAYVSLLLLEITVHISEQQSLQLLMNPRTRNTINLTCTVTGQLNGNLDIDFLLNQTNVNDLQDLIVNRQENDNTVTVIIEMESKYEGTFFCALCSNQNCLLQSNPIGPIAGETLLFNSVPH